MQTYDSGGKAKKSCPKCNTFIHARTLTCPSCSHEFGKRKTIIKDPEIFTEPGKGRKLCSNCAKYAGAKSKACPNCKTEFVKREKIVVVDKPVAPIENLQTPKKQYIEQEKIASHIGSLVYAPCGECPYNLNSESREDVRAWCRKVYKHGLDNKKTYTKTAIIYWLIINQYEPKLREFVDEWCSEEGYESNLADSGEHEEYPEGESEASEFLSLQE